MKYTVTGTSFTVFQCTELDLISVDKEQLPHLGKVPHPAHSFVALSGLTS